MAEEKKELERRKDLRVILSQPLTLKLKIQKQKDLIRLRPRKSTSAENISVGGVRIELPLLKEEQVQRILHGQDKLLLELNIPYLSKPLTIVGKLAWFRKKDKGKKVYYLAGISFDGIREADRENILIELINLCLKGKAQT